MRSQYPIAYSMGAAWRRAGGRIERNPFHPEWMRDSFRSWNAGFNGEWISWRVYNLRVDVLGETLAQFAARLGCSLSLLSKIETGAAATSERIASRLDAIENEQHVRAAA